MDVRKTRKYTSHLAAAVRSLLSQQHFLTEGAMVWLPSHDALLLPADGLPPPPKRPRCDRGGNTRPPRHTAVRQLAAVVEQPVALSLAATVLDVGGDASADLAGVSGGLITIRI